MRKFIHVFLFVPFYIVSAQLYIGDNIFACNFKHFINQEIYQDLVTRKSLKVDSHGVKGIIIVCVESAISIIDLKKSVKDFSKIAKIPKLQVRKFRRVELKEKILEKHVSIVLFEIKSSDSNQYFRTQFADQNQAIGSSLDWKKMILPNGIFIQISIKIFTTYPEIPNSRTTLYKSARYLIIRPPPYYFPTIS